MKGRAKPIPEILRYRWRVIPIGFGQMDIVETDPRRHGLGRLNGKADSVGPVTAIAIRAGAEGAAQEWFDQNTVGTMAHWPVCGSTIHTLASGESADGETGLASAWKLGWLGQMLGITAASLGLVTANGRL